jgi:MscS family membrane protein
MAFPSVLNFELYGVHMSRLLGGIMQLLLVIAVTWLAVRVVDFVGEVMADRAALTETTQDDQFVLFIKDVMRVVVYIVAIFLVLGAVLDLNITSLLAGAGLAGLAVALAAQDSLANLFGSLTIFSEKPFLMGDLVETNGILGTIEKVGFRSTRIRTLDKTFVTLPNRMIMENPINNLTDRTFRRVDYTVGVLYGTPANTIKTIVDRIQKLIDEHPRTNEDGIVAFHAFGPSSLDIKVIYFIREVNWNAYLQIRQEVTLGIMQAVLDNGGDFAFPTTTVHLEQENSASGEDSPSKPFRNTADPHHDQPSLGDDN